ncbi:EpsI family protein [Pelomonas sp. HMWF004]|nr:EpsI family protein [Pelomonas sp. HMWF004]
MRSLDNFFNSLKRLPTLSMRPALVLCVCAVAAVLAAQQLRPTRHAERDGVALNTMLPQQVGPWQALQSNLVQMSLTPEGQDRTAAVAATYDDTAMASYTDGNGAAVMVALAYGRSQRQEGKIHRPELCYSAQGYSVLNQTSVSLPLALAGAADTTVRIHRIEAGSRQRREIVSYWIRIGDLFTTSAFQTRTHIMKVGLQGEIPDGILFRVSQVVPSDLEGAALDAAYARQEAFMVTLASSLQGGGKKMLVGDRLAALTGGAHAAS